MYFTNKSKEIQMLSTIEKYTKSVRNLNKSLCFKGVYFIRWKCKVLLYWSLFNSDVLMRTVNLIYANCVLHKSRNSINILRLFCTRPNFQMESKRGFRSRKNDLLKRGFPSRVYIPKNSCESAKKNFQKI